MAQRDRAASLNQEEKALQRAKDSDRAAKSQLTKRFKSSDEYHELPKLERAQLLQERIEELMEKRMVQKRSGER